MKNCSELILLPDGTAACKICNEPEFTIMPIVREEDRDFLGFAYVRDSFIENNLDRVEVIPVCDVLKV